MIEDALQPYTALVAGIDPQATPFGETVHRLDLIDAAIRRLRELKAEGEALAVEQLQAIGPQVVGSVRYYAGPDRDHKVRDVRATVRAMLELFDMDALNDCLSTSAVKAGAFRKACEGVGHPEWFAEHFETTERMVLKEGKPPRPALQKVDTAFLRGGR